MRKSRKEITKEQYDIYKQMSHKQFLEEVEAGLPDYIVCGYGFYGASLVETDDKYYIEMTIGTCCD